MVFELFGQALKKLSKDGTGIAACAHERGIGNV